MERSSDRRAPARSWRTEAGRAQPRGVISRLRAQVTRFHHEETGKVTLLAGIMMLAIAVLAGLIGNAGHTVNQKLEAQNAADAAAFSSALWMARGMNAITATNHLLGEVTALAVLHEAIGGPELDAGIRANTPENRNLDAVIDATRNSAPVGTPVPSPFGYTPPPIPATDKRIVDFVTGRTTPRSGTRELSAFATVYDAKMTLKRELALLLPLKSYANVGFFVPPPWGYATAAAAYGVHIYATAQIVLIGKEWIILDVLERAARLFTPLKRNILERQLVPALVAHAEFVAGLDDSPEPQEGILNRAIERAVQDLAQNLDVEAALFPDFEDLRLPVQPEPAPGPTGQSGASLEGWGTDAPSVIPATDTGLDALQRLLGGTQRNMRRRIARLREDLRQLDDYEQAIDDLLEGDDMSDADRAQLESEKSGGAQPAGSIASSRREKSDRLEEAEQALDELARNEAARAAALNQPLPSQSDNLSIDSIPQRMHAPRERYTQWVRAAYPYVDSFRAAVRSFRAPAAGLAPGADGWLPKSKTAEHFTKWTNRYTLVKAWQYRSGYRPARSGNRIGWSRDAEPLAMLVLRDAFQNDRARKGQEPWTRSSPAGKRAAEEQFTLLAFAHRPFNPLFSPLVYPAPNEQGMTTYAQAIFYNANPQRTGSGTQRWQARLGWDTLNWDPDTRAPEWGSPPSERGARWPWEVFSGSSPTVNVKLNWQAKLVPVTASRLEESPADLPAAMRENVEHAVKYFAELGSH